MKLDDTICYCFHISKRKILNFIRIYRPRRASQVSECGGAGTGCGWCVNFLKRYHEQVLAGCEEPDETVSSQEYARNRGAYIRAGRGKPPASAIPIPESSAVEAEPESERTESE